MKKWAHTLQLYLHDGTYIWSVVLSFIFLFASLVVNWFAGVYATESASNYVTDVVLSNIRTYDVDGFLVYGTFVFWAFLALICLRYPEKIPFTLHSIALFVFIRSVFISVTHIGPFPTQLVVDSYVLAKFMFAGDLFFSGHTGLPFLLALIYWDHLALRVTFVLTSIFFGTVVLLAHVHYSIDVLSAFFITYSIYRLAEHFYAKEYRLFKHGLAI